MHFFLEVIIHILAVIETEVRWDKGGPGRAEDYTFFYGKINGTQLGTRNFVHQQLKRVKLVSDRMSYIVLRGRWCDTIVLNGLAPTENRNDDSKGHIL
jgi:hypothetical protein